MATWTLTTDAPRDVLEALLPELGLRKLLNQLDVPGVVELSLIGESREYPSAELKRLRGVLVDRGYLAQCRLLGSIV